MVKRVFTVGGVYKVKRMRTDARGRTARVLKVDLLVVGGTTGLRLTIVDREYLCMSQLGLEGKDMVAEEEMK